MNARSLLLLPFMFGLGACAEDTEPNGNPPENNPIEVPEAYEFPSRHGDGDAVSNAGQIMRHVLLADLGARIAGMTERLDQGTWVPDVDAMPRNLATDELNFFFQFDGESGSEAPLALSTAPNATQSTYGDLGSKNLVSKLAGNDSATDHKDWASDMVGWQAEGVDSPQSLVEHWMGQLDAAALGRSRNEALPTDPSGAAITKVYVTAAGQDLRQLLAKFIAMGVFFSQATDDYLDDDVDGKGLRQSNAQVVKDGTPKPYSGLGHGWDEAFGYFGAARDYAAYTDDEIAGKGPDGGARSKGYHDSNGDGAIDLQREYNHGHSRNAAKRDRGSADSAKTDFTGDVFAAFLAGRTLILNAGDTLTDAELTQLKTYRDAAVTGWEACIAATAVHYINDTLQDMNTFGTADYNFYNHAKHWSELKGFALGLQFNPRSKLSSADFARLHDLIGQAPALPGADNVTAYREGLLTARALLAERYGFATANMGDDQGEGGW